MCDGCVCDGCMCDGCVYDGCVYDGYVCVMGVCMMGVCVMGMERSSCTPPSSVLSRVVKLSVVSRFVRLLTLHVYI